VNKPEILAPAGDLEKLKFAIEYGADAVYAGGSSFGLRAYAGNLKEEELRLGVEYTHQHRRKIYITVNIFAHEQDFAALIPYLEFLREIKVDGIIVSDPGVLAVVRQETPELAVHLSTQPTAPILKAPIFGSLKG
jgi:putative protease